MVLQPLSVLRSRLPVPGKFPGHAHLCPLLTRISVFILLIVSVNSSIGGIDGPVLRHGIL